MASWLVVKGAVQKATPILLLTIFGWKNGKKDGKKLYMAITPSY